jgi:glycosyltransferase involved in cell wall biosynthesis
MELSLEEQLLLVLSEEDEKPALGRRYRAIEQILNTHLGGNRAEKLQPTTMQRPDIYISRQGAAPIAAELQILKATHFANNIRNRTSGLLATAVQTRRYFMDDVFLLAIVLISEADQEFRESKSSLWNEAARNLLRASDGAGYDRVLIGLAGAELNWESYEADPLGGDPQIRRLGTHEAFHSLRSNADPARLFVHPSEGKPTRRFLLVADEWRSGKGGLSTLNRELAIALTSAGYETAVFVPETTDADLRAASAHGVSLVTPARISGLSDREALLLRPVFAEKDWAPDVIVGHGRSLGPYAAAQQQQFFPHARRIHFVHTDAESLESAKETLGGESLMTRADSRRTLEIDLARSADLVAGIGPLLTESIRDDLLGPGRRASVVPFIPGLRSTFDAASARHPVKNRVLFIGRADDFSSKGIDIAAEALLRVVDTWPPDRPHHPVLVVRGVPEDASNEVKANLDAIFEGRVEYRLRPYADSEAAVVADLAQARVTIMPSRHEGFGLAAFEAIATGIPVLIGRASGLAQLLLEEGLDSSPSSIVATRDTATRLAVDAWADAIQHILDNQDAARTEAIALRSALSKVVSWQSSVQSLLNALDSRRTRSI